MGRTALRGAVGDLDMIRAYTDGGSRGNPGPSGIGVVLCDRDDRVLSTHKEYLGAATNNEAEYTAVLRALELAAGLTRGEVVLTSDSELVVRQLRGAYAVREARLAALVARVREREAPFRRVRYVHRPRLTGHLALADRLVNEALDASELPRS